MPDFMNEELIRRRLAPLFSQNFPVVPDAPQQVPQMTPAQQNYQNVLSTEPQIADYKPSRFRNIMAMIAAGGQGAVHGGQAGIDAGTAVKYAPFRGAQSAFQQKLQAAERGMGFESSLEKSRQEGALSRAKIGRLGTQSDSDIATADAQRELGRYRGKQGGALPGSYEESVQGQERVRKAGIAPVRPLGVTTNLDSKRGVAVTTNRDTGAIETRQYGEPIKTLDTEGLARLRHDLRMNELRFTEGRKDKRAQLGGTPPRGPSAASQKTAEILATKRLAELNPEFAELLDEKGNIKPFSAPWLGNVEEAQKRYNSFLIERDRIRDEILRKSGTQRANVVLEDDDDIYELKEEDDEDQ
jgi:hypothetical protein